MRIGFDNGNVLCESDTEFLRSGDLSVAHQIPGGFETVALATEHYGVDSNWIVSACGPRVQGYSWQWLVRENFFEQTGFRHGRFALPVQCTNGEDFRAELTSNHVLFCEKREQKALIAQVLELDAFVDDRIGILLSLPDCVELRIAFRPRPKELRQLGAQLDSRFMVVQSWTEARSLLGLAV